MAQMPRTPVHFPRMKVRGRRNKAKLAARHTTLTVIPHARPERTATGYTLTALVSPEANAVRLEFTTVVDGYGRRLKPLSVQSIAPVKPKPKPQFSVSFKAAHRMADGIWDLLTVRVRDGEG